MIYSLRSQVSRSFTYVTLVQRLQDERKSVTQSFATSHDNNYGITHTFNELSTLILEKILTMKR